MACVAGSEFLLPVRGFFCVLCEKFFGDSICAEEHVTAHCHNDNYKVSDARRRLPWRSFGRSQRLARERLGKLA